MSINDNFKQIAKDYNAIEKRVKHLETRVVDAPLYARKAKTHTISSGIIEIVSPNILLLPESGVADTLTTINGGVDGKMIVVATAEDGDTITIEPFSMSGGNIDMRGSGNGRILLDPHDSVFLIYRENTSHWEQVNPQWLDNLVGVVIDFDTLADGDVLTYDFDNGNWVNLPGGSSSVTAFTDLTDVPPSYAGFAGYIPAVNGTEDGLEFLDPSTLGTMGGFGGNSVEYNFDSSTAMSDPGTGDLRFDSGTYSSVANIVFHKNEANGVDISNWLSAINTSGATDGMGTLRIFKKDDSTVFAIYSVAVIANFFPNPEWYAQVSHIVHNGSFSNGDRIVVSYVNKGIDGAAAPDTFLDLTDTPDDYSGQAGKFVIVNGTEDALEFTDTIDADTLQGQAGSYYLDRTNHTNTQLAATISDFDTQVRTNRLDQMASPTASVSFNSQLITNLANPVSAQDAATKSYVDALQFGMDVKASVRAASTADLTLSGEQTVDGVALVTGDRILVKNQTAGEENGIYVVDSGAWSRSEDADSDAEVTAGLYTFVSEGTVNGDNGFAITTNDPIVLDTDPITFTQVSGLGQVVAGDALSKSGNTLNVNVDGVTIEVSSDALRRMALTGDVTSSAGSAATTIANNAVTTAKILDANVTFAKFQQISTDRLLGRDTAATGNVEEISLDATLAWSGAGAIGRAAITGDVTISAASNAATIPNNTVTYAKMQDVSATDKVLGRSTAGSGDVEEITFTAAARALADDADAAAMRTTLGLVAAGAGDIWVEKAGDTMSGQLKLDLTLLLSDSSNSGSQDFMLTASGALYFIQSQTSGAAAEFGLATKDMDGTDTVLTEVWGKGGPGSTTNRERVQLGWDASNTYYLLRTENSGTGTLRPLRLFTGNNTSQLVLNTDGSIDIGGATDIDGALNTTGDIGLNRDGASGTINVVSYGTGFQSQIALYMFRGSLATPTATQSGDTLGTIYFGGWDTAASLGARIRAVATAEWGTAADTTDNPTKLEFLTTPDGSSTNTLAMTIDDDQSVHIGAADANATNQFSVSGTAATTGIYRYVASSFGPQLNFYKSRNATVGSHTIVNDGDAIGLINFLGSNGTTFDTAASIGGRIDGTPGASTDMPGSLEFAVSAEASVTPSIVAIIHNSPGTSALTAIGASVLGIKAGNSTNDAAVGGVLFSTVTSQGNVGTGEDQLLNGTSGYTLPANTLSADGMAIRITAWGSFANNANNKRFRVRFGNAGTNLAFDTTAGAYTNQIWFVETIVIRTGATTQDAITNAFIGGNGGGVISASYMQFAALTQTLSGTVLIQVTGETTTAANNDIVLEGAIIEYLDKNT